MTPVQQQELLEALWIIVVGFVDLGFGIHPVQQVLDVGKNHSALEADSTRVIACKKTFSTKAKQDRDANGTRSEG